MRLPRHSGINPDTRAAASSSVVQPPSGPTRSVSIAVAKDSGKSHKPFFAVSESIKHASAAVPLLKFFHSLICAPSQLDNDIRGSTCGTRFLPHCSQAEMTTSCQCFMRFSARSPESLTTPSFVSRGCMRLTHTSPAFCTIPSLFSLAHNA